METRPLFCLAGLDATGGVIGRVGCGVDPFPVLFVGPRVNVGEAVSVIPFGGDGGCIDVFDGRLVVVEERKLQAGPFDATFDEVGKLDGFTRCSKFETWG